MRADGVRADGAVQADGAVRAGGAVRAADGRADPPVWPLALATAVVAVLIAVPALPEAPDWLGRCARAVTGAGPLDPAPAAVLGLALAFVARGVVLRRRAAWGVLVVLLGAALLAVLAGDGWAWRAPPLAAALGGLWLARDGFPVRPHPGRVRAAVWAAALPVAVAVSGSLLLGLPARPDGPGAGGIGGIGTPVDGASWVPDVLGLAGAAGLLVLVVLLTAPDPAPPPAGEADRRRVAALIAHPGSDTLAPFALRRDRAYAFSADGRAAIGYRVLFGVAVAGGDPVGDPASHADAAGAFLARCRAAGWRPAVLAASDDLVPVWGLRHAIGYGDEVLVRPGEFSLAGRRMRNVRQAVQRTANAGVTTRITPERELDPALRERLADIASRSLGGAAERGFAMNLDELLTGRHPGTLIAVARDGGGEPVAFQRYVTAGGGVSLDAMRRLPGGPNGVNERLIVEMIGYAARHGLGVVSLNFAAFRGLLAAEERNALERAGHRALHVFDRWIAAESLYLFDEKFRPSYKRRSVVFRSWLDAAWLAAAILTLEFGRPAPSAAPDPAALRPAPGPVPRRREP